MKYVVICVIDREIYKLGVTDSPKEATEIMQNDFMEAFLDKYTEEDYAEGNYQCEEWDCGKTDAWLNGRGEQDMDWTILEVE